MALTRFIHQDQRGLERNVEYCPVPTDAVSNASFSLSYTGTKVDYVEKTIDGVTYRRTFTWTGDNLTAISEWVEQ